MEDKERRHERAIQYLLQRDVDLTDECEDLQNRSRRNNLRIYQVSEGDEGIDVTVILWPRLLTRVPKKRAQVQVTVKQLMQKNVTEKYQKIDLFIRHK